MTIAGCMRVLEVTNDKVVFVMPKKVIDLFLPEDGPGLARLIGIASGLGNIPRGVTATE